MSVFEKYNPKEIITAADELARQDEMMYQTKETQYRTIPKNTPSGPQTMRTRRSGKDKGASTSSENPKIITDGFRWGNYPKLKEVLMKATKEYEQRRGQTEQQQFNTKLVQDIK